MWWRTHLERGAPMHPAGLQIVISLSIASARISAASAPKECVGLPDPVSYTHLRAHETGAYL
eukprot:1652362-Pyramimonas_sp.AAC.1